MENLFDVRLKRSDCKLGHFKKLVHGSKRRLWYQMERGFVTIEVS